MLGGTNGSRVLSAVKEKMGANESLIVMWDKITEPRRLTHMELKSGGTLEPRSPVAAYREMRADGLLTILYGAVKLH